MDEFYIAALVISLKVLSIEIFSLKSPKNMHKLIKTSNISLCY